MGADLIRLAHNAVGLGGQVLAEQLCAVSCLAAGEKERALDGAVGEVNSFWLETELVAREIAAFMEFLGEARADFFPVHLGDAAELAVPSGTHTWLLSYMVRVANSAADWGKGTPKCVHLRHGKRG